MVFETIFTASTASFTSCTLKMSAPPNKASVFKIVVPFRLSSGVYPKYLYIIDLRDIPTNKAYTGKFVESVHEQVVVVDRFAESESRIDDDIVDTEAFESGDTC